jgi:hypothetical protein
MFLCGSCSSNDNTPATLQVKLTDAPGDFDEVNIDIEDVQVNSDATSNSGWKSLNVKKGVYNLLKLTNGIDTLLGGIQLPAGKVSQIRLVLGNDNKIKVSGVEYPLNTPRAQQSGLKILVNTDLKAGITYQILLDFDVARSIVTTGSGIFNLKPVIRSVVEAENGAIKGLINPVESTPAVYALIGADTIATTFADTVSGKFLLKGVPAGTYTVSFQPKTGYLTSSKSNVSVTLGSVTDLGTIEISK